ncbi:AMP-binding protein [Streptomyces platensis]|uniref:AMP-binding protein n=1 Tax=Streptomyces platensis TaxID=58346 RepID=UPI0037A70DCD
MFEAIREEMIRDIDNSAAPGWKFSWPSLADFNWATDWFDSRAKGNHDPAVIWSDVSGTSQQISYEGLRECSDRVAGWLMRQGVGPGTRIVVSLSGVGALWEIQLAALKLGAIIVPVPPAVGSAELMDILAFSGATVVITDPESAQEVQPASTWTGVTVGGCLPGWSLYEDSYSHAARYRPRECRHSRMPFLLECTGAGATSGRLRGWLHSRYACTVSRLTDLYFTRLRPGQRFVSAAPAGSVEHMCFSSLGPLTAGVTTLTMGPQDGVSAVDIVSRAVGLGAQSAYIPMALFDVSEGANAPAPTPHPEVELLSSLTTEALVGMRADARAQAAGGAWPVVPGNARWGVRHHQTSTAVMTQAAGTTRGEKSRTRALPGHDLQIVSPQTGEPAEVGELRIGLRRWPWPDGGMPAPYGDAHRRPGIESIDTGLFGRRLPDGSVMPMPA